LNDKLFSNIKKGVSAEDLHNLYNVTDLQEWCKRNNLNYTGKKPAIIKRILHYLQTGQRPIKKLLKKRKRKGSEGGSHDSMTGGGDSSTQTNSGTELTMDDSEMSGKSTDKMEC
jgi:hypothetical protein